jgi:hypothetical protein
MRVNIGNYTVELTDDGTLDTVLVVYPRIRPSKREEVRFSDTAEHRKSDGSLSKSGFKTLAAEAVEQYEEQHAQDKGT